MRRYQEPARRSPRRQGWALNFLTGGHCVNALIAPSQIAPQPEPSAAAAKFLKRAPRLFIGGEWVEAASRERISVVDPATGRQIASVVDANAADVDRAVAAVRRAPRARTN